MNNLETLFSQIIGAVKMFNFFDLLDIILISYLVYKAIKLVRETRAEQLVKGIILLAISYFLSTFLQLKSMSYLLKNFFQIGIIALIVLFQPEIRRVLEKVGRTKVADFSVFSNENPEKKEALWKNAIEKIPAAVLKLGESKTGALIVIERKTKLGEQIDTGVMLNATITEELIGNIFFVNTPLHDGATIIRDGKILAAACFLPKPQKEDHIASYLGSRHRAALGISEISDSLTIVVSEETGTISVAENGELIRGFSKNELQQLLSEKLLPKKEIEEKQKHKPFWRSKK